MENRSFEEWEEYDTISYVAAIHMLLDGKELNFYAHDDIEQPSIMVDNEYCQVYKIRATGEESEWDVDWDTIRLVIRLAEKEVTLSSETISQKDAFELLRAIYEITDSGEYEDLWQFLGYEIS